jgi:transposase-like protein
MACADEQTAVEFFEARLWKGTPKCPHCQSTHVYQMKDSKTGQRNKRFLWRCHDCKDQFTVRIGTVLEESRLPLRHWAYAFWRASTSKKGVSAKEIQRQCQISYEGALFLMHRIRFAMTQNCSPSPKLNGTIEYDETFVGGRPRRDSKGIRKPSDGYRSGTNKIPVAAVIQRGGAVKAKVVARVNQKNLKHFLAETADKSATVNTDGSPFFPRLFSDFARHDVVSHNRKEYARRNADGTVSHVNTCESFFAVMKRGLHGIFHAVSKKHLHRYCGEFEFRWNHRQQNDGNRTVAAIESAIGKRLSYEECIA